MITNLDPKNANNFVCERCAFKCTKKSNYEKHLLTLKHQNDDISLHKKKPQKVACICGKKYTHRQGLYTHKQTCRFINTNKQINDEGGNTNLTSMVIELMKSNTELQKQMLEMCKIGNNNTIISNNNNNSNNNNKTFNLQFFLNEQCKDAMNISEFTNSFDLQLSDLESLGELGYVEGMTKIFLDKLSSTDIYKRPMHCSDTRREIIYIKDENKWEKEQINNPKLRYAIKTISFKNMKLTNLWSDTYPESKDNETRLNDTYMKLVLQSTGGSGEIGDSENKIIRRIAKEIFIDKNILTT